MAYRHHAPLTTHIRINDVGGVPLSSLLDTGASLSVIDRHLLEMLGGTVVCQAMPIQGLGSATSLGWSTVTFFLDATTEKGRPAELCVTRDAVVPARSHAWVPVDTASLAPGLDHTAHPRLAVDATESVRLAGPLAVIHSQTSHVLLTNLGTSDAHLARRTPVADAVVAQLGDVDVVSAHTFELHAGSVAAQMHTVDPSAPAAFETDADPLEMCEQVDDATFPSPLKDDTTVLVNGAFKVGVDAWGRPPDALVEVLRRHREAFALDGRPGRVVGHEMPIDLADDRELHPEAPRRASPEKQRAMDAAIDQLLEWDVIEPSTSPISFPVLMIRQYAKWRFCVDYRQLNAQTIPDAYPLPTTDSIFNSLAGKRMYSSLDAIRGYHQLPVRESDRWKTAFTCHRGLCQFKTVL
ncbi:hypothetical protein A4X13_0g4466 [Tilletia indica]|uniref:Uncharacterized protein n=1 Tax=Tilletia indica TaxID=43049 RepID=A0A177TJ73_9BASI|nr:hypothetical protein A4X13_0g4466 [Tilletia indica]